MAYEFTHGTGTPEDPYQVWTAEDLAGVNDHLDAHFVQKADIDLASWGYWETLGSWGTYFTGTYDGEGHTIQNLTCTGKDSDTEEKYEHYTGLFEYMDGATVENLVMRNFVLEDSGGFSGCLSGWADDCTVRNIRVFNSSYSGEANCVGGLLGGVFNITMENVYVECDITYEETGWTTGTYIGGIFGELFLDNGSPEDTVEQVYYKGTINLNSGPGSHSGGFAGQVNAGSSDVVSIEQVGVDVTIASPEGAGNFLIGGFSGCFYGNVRLENCYVRGQIDPGDASGADHVGGFIGDFSPVGDPVPGIVHHCYAAVEMLNGDANNGPFIGSLWEDQYLAISEDCYFDSEVSGYAEDASLAQPKTTAEMKNPATYDGWDFETIWAIDTE